MERQVGQILESASIETSFGINRWEASELSNIVRIFERIGDHCYIITKLCLEQDIPEMLRPEEVPASVIPTWQKSIKSLISNLKKRKIKEIQESKFEIQKAVRSLDEFVIEGIVTTIPLHKKLLTNKKFVNSDFNVSWLDNEKIL